MVTESRGSSITLSWTIPEQAQQNGPPLPRNFPSAYLIFLLVSLGEVNFGGDTAELLKARRVTQQPFKQYVARDNSGRGRGG